MELESLEKNSLYVLKGDVLDRLVAKAAANQSTPPPSPPTNEAPISQPEAIRLWKTTRQRLATLRRQGKIEALELNGRIYYRPQAYYDAMQSLRHKKPLV
ncbi:hypothetical protein [Desulfobacter postgatei]|uniref:hypothetical protein n=1 Tax=Desulfobacter postgatei TaxID=2293 RepID=UPI002FDB551B